MRDDTVMSRLSHRARCVPLATRLVRAVAELRQRPESQMVRWRLGIGSRRNSPLVAPVGRRQRTNLLRRHGPGAVSLIRRLLHFPGPAVGSFELPSRGIDNAPSLLVSVVVMIPAVEAVSAGMIPRGFSAAMMQVRTVVIVGAITIFDADEFIEPLGGFVLDELVNYHLSTACDVIAVKQTRVVQLGHV